MAKKFRLPKRINGLKLPKGARKHANAVLAKVQGKELEVLAGVVLGAVIAHFADKEGDTALSRRIGKAVGGHLGR